MYAISHHAARIVAAGKRAAREWQGEDDCMQRDLRATVLDAVTDAVADAVHATYGSAGVLALDLDDEGASNAPARIWRRAVCSAYTDAVLALTPTDDRAGVDGGAL